MQMAVMRKTMLLMAMPLLMAASPPLLAASPPTPKTIMLDAADYPEAASEAGVEGDVRFELDIDAKGKVSGCTVTAGGDLPAGLAAGTCAAVTKRWRFEPARDDAGVKVPGRLSFSIAWRIALPCPRADGETICVFL
jgi:TonB family protein